MIKFWNNKLNKYKEEIVKELRQLQKDTESIILFHCDSDVEHGASGSPCIDNESGNVVAMFQGCVPRHYFDIRIPEDEEEQYLENRLEIALDITRGYFHEWVKNCKTTDSINNKDTV